MAANDFQTLPGFRDFFPAECAVRNYVFEHWRGAAARYGFAEYEAPILEPTDLYRRKSGAEIVDQLFNFSDKGGREVALRPELTPSLARMASDKAREYKKPMKWFEIGQCFRYEKPQFGRLREFYQFNCDILGETSVAADAELIALAIDLMRGLGFTEADFEVRVGSREGWSSYLAGLGKSEHETSFLQAIDKLGRESDEATEKKLAPVGISLAQVREIIASESSHSESSRALFGDLEARGLGGFLRLDLGTVRGLAYYTGVVFEVFAKNPKFRAVAGGGRYDSLCALVAGGKKGDLPACGFAMGDVVIADLIKATPNANRQLTEYLSEAFVFDAYVVVADEAKRPDALALVQKLRTAGYRIDFALTPTKYPKQLQMAEHLQARYAVVVGDEYPDVIVKTMADRGQTRLPESQLVAALGEEPDTFKLA